MNPKKKLRRVTAWVVFSDVDSLMSKHIDDNMGLGPVFKSKKAATDFLQRFDYELETPKKITIEWEE